MCRRAAAVVCIVGGLLAFATVAMWVRSTRIEDYLGWGRVGGRYVQIIAREGIVCVDVVSTCPADQSLTWRWIAAGKQAEFVTVYNGNTRSFVSRQLAGVKIISAVTDFVPPRQASNVDLIWNAHWHEVRFPYIDLFGVLGIFPLGWAAILILRRISRKRRIHRQLCLQCGYDLRMSSGLCPECGAIQPKND